MNRPAKKGSKKTPPKWSEVKAAIGGLSSSKVVALVGDLFRLSQENRDFLHARFASSGDPLVPYKKIITAALYPDVTDDEPISIETAKRAISQYARASGDQKGVLELMVHFVETGNQFTLDYGDVDGPFYDAILRMYKRAIERLLELGKDTVQAYLPRFREIMVSSESIGWGYHDDLADIYEEHLRRFDEKGEQQV